MKILLMLVMSGSAFAAGDGHGGPMDLIAPAVNLSILLGFLAYKLKGPASNFFSGKSASVSEMMERASVKAKEAEMMMQMQSKKMEGANEEISKIESDVDSEISKFKTAYESEVQERIRKMKEEAGLKIEAEKKELLDELNSTLLDQVIAKTKATLKNDNTLNENATKGIVEGIK